MVLCKHRRSFFGLASFLTIFPVSPPFLINTLNSSLSFPLTDTPLPVSHIKPEASWMRATTVLHRENCHLLRPLTCGAITVNIPEIGLYYHRNKCIDLVRDYKVVRLAKDDDGISTRSLSTNAAFLSERSGRLHLGLQFILSIIFSYTIAAILNLLSPSAWMLLQIHADL